MASEDVLVSTETFSFRDNQTNPGHTFAATNIGKVHGFDVRLISIGAAQDSGNNSLLYTFQATLVYTLGGAAADLFTLDIHQFFVTEGNDNTQAHGNVQQTRDQDVVGFKVIRLRDTQKGGTQDLQKCVGFFGNFGETNGSINYRVLSHRFDAVTDPTTPDNFLLVNNNDTATPAPSDTHLTTMSGGQTNSYYVFVASQEDMP